MTTQQRWLAIAAFGLVALILSLKAPAPDELVAPVSKTRARDNMTNQKANNLTPKNLKQDALKIDTLKLDTLQPRSMAQVDKEDMFKSKSWTIAPPPPPKPKYVPPPPPPPPTAPPLPYKLMGSFQDPDKKLVVYLSRGDRLYSVSAGDVLDGTYKVESINAGQLEMLYLPLNIRQNLRLGDR